MKYYIKYTCKAVPIQRGFCLDTILVGILDGLGTIRMRWIASRTSHCQHLVKFFETPIWKTIEHMDQLLITIVSTRFCFWNENISIENISIEVTRRTSGVTHLGANTQPNLQGRSPPPPKLDHIVQRPGFE